MISGHLVSGKVSVYGLVTISVLTKNLVTRLQVLQCDQGHDGAQHRVGREKCEPEDSVNDNLRRTLFTPATLY